MTQNFTTKVGMTQNFMTNGENFTNKIRRDANSGSGGGADSRFPWLETDK